MDAWVIDPSVVEGLQARGYTARAEEYTLRVARKDGVALAAWMDPCDLSSLLFGGGGMSKYRGCLMPSIDYDPAGFPVGYPDDVRGTLQELLVILDAFDGMEIRLQDLLGHR